MMSGIRGKNTRPELTVRRFLHRAGFRYRLHAKLPGKPDLVLPRYRVAVFIHGCFWHRHEGCRYTTTPKTNPEFWQKKFSENVERDARACHALEGLGWRVMIIWACQIAAYDLEKVSAEIKENRLVDHET
jgi:DNA mismatch endonuclease (patch repair protein)